MEIFLKINKMRKIIILMTVFFACNHHTESDKLRKATLYMYAINWGNCKINESKWGLLKEYSIQDQNLHLRKTVYKKDAIEFHFSFYIGNDTNNICKHDDFNYNICFKDNGVVYLFGGPGVSSFIYYKNIEFVTNDTINVKNIEFVIDDRLKTYKGRLPKTLEAIL